jgi:hypothetical protein
MNRMWVPLTVVVTVPLVAAGHGGHVPDGLTLDLMCTLACLLAGGAGLVVLATLAQEEPAMNVVRVGVPFAAILLLMSVVSTGCGAGSAQSRASDLGKLAYVVDGVIYVKDLPDGEAARIAEGRAPRWSPSGEWLLFFSQGSEWVMRSDGSGRRPLSGDSAVWSSTEDRFAYYEGPTERNPSTSLLVESADGSSRREAWVLADPWSSPEWNPDGTRLAYSQEGAVPCGFDLNGGSYGKSPGKRRSSLCVLDADAETAGARPVELYESTTSGSVAAGWTSDSRYVLFWLDLDFANSAMNDGLPMYSLPASGGEPRELTFSLLSGIWEPSPAGGATILMTEGASRYRADRLLDGRRHGLAAARLVA